LKKIAKLPFVEFCASGGKIKEADMPKFYRGLDVVVQCASIEGGSMAITESLAQGLPIVCYENVGVANEFDQGVLRVPFGREDMFLKRLEDMWESQDHINLWREPAQMEAMRTQVLDFTWENFTKDHDKVWKEICE
jgi:glycosyltransferase involved in cell wall biosynthesis